MKCLNETAQDNAMTATKNGIAACYNHPSQNIIEMDINDDGFDFINVENTHDRSNNILGITTCDIEF